jgi:pyruvate dehydrogenase complex dehydrogenase (E1) component
MPSKFAPIIPDGRAYKVLGTDGFGRSDFRSKLREHFEVNRHYIVVAALKALSEEGVVPGANRGRSHCNNTNCKRTKSIRCTLDAGGENTWQQWK